MKRETEIVITKQAKELLENMEHINSEELLDWFCNHRRIHCGGGDVVEFLEWKKQQENK